jgi:protein gp37
MKQRCEEAGVAFFFKQSAAPRTEMGTTLDGQIIRQYPRARIPVVS